MDQTENGGTEAGIATAADDAAAAECHGHALACVVGILRLLCALESRGGGADGGAGGGDGGGGGVGGGEREQDAVALAIVSITVNADRVGVWAAGLARRWARRGLDSHAASAIVAFSAAASLSAILEQARAAAPLPPVILGQGTYARGVRPGPIRWGRGSGGARRGAAG